MSLQLKVAKVDEKEAGKLAEYIRLQERLSSLGKRNAVVAANLKNNKVGLEDLNNLATDVELGEAAAKTVKLKLMGVFIDMELDKTKKYIEKKIEFLEEEMRKLNNKIEELTLLKNEKRSEITALV